MAPFEAIMSQIKHYPIKFLAESKETLSKDELSDAREQTRVLKLTRGNFLDYIIDVELIIDILIENFVIHKRSNLKRVFRNKILNNRNVPFMHKIKLLYAIIKEKKGLNPSQLKVLEGSLNSLKDERNKWAHGKIHFKQEKKAKTKRLQSYLVWVTSKGEESELRLTNSYFDGLEKKFKVIQKLLVKILVKRKFLPKEYLFGK